MNDIAMLPTKAKWNERKITLGVADEPKVRLFLRETYKVERMATPIAAEACLWVEKIAEARPVSGLSIFEYVAAWSGTNANDIDIPRKNMRI